MAYDEVQIWNLALSHSASQRFVAAIGDTGAEGDLCRVHYAPSRDAVLRDHHWPFAGRFIALALVAEAATQPWASEWRYAYRYPADCVRVRRILTGLRMAPIEPEYELGSDPSGRLIFTDLPNAGVAYTHRVTDTSLFSDEFAQAVAWRMAWLMALPLSGRTDLRQQAQAEYERAIADAKASSLGEQQRDPQPDAEWIRAREG